VLESPFGKAEDCEDGYESACKKKGADRVIGLRP
jgi:hypothetical protein